MNPCCTLRKIQIVHSVISNYRIFRKETFINTIDTLRRCRLQITYLRVFDYHHESKYFIRDIYWFLTFNFGNNNEIRK